MDRFVGDWRVDLGNDRAFVSLRSLFVVVVIFAASAFGVVEGLRRLAPSDGSRFDPLSFEKTFLVLEPRSMDDHASVQIKLLNRSNRNQSVPRIAGSDGFGTVARIEPTSAVIHAGESVDVFLDFSLIREGRNWYQIHAIGVDDVARCEIVFDGLRKPPAQDEVDVE